MANVVDLTTIQDERKRLLAERICILAGKDFILHQESFRTGEDYVRGVERARKAAESSL